MAYKNKEDQAAAARRHYEKNKAQVKARAKAWSQKERERRRSIIAAMKDVPCADCGNSYPSYVMDFDHREGEEKIECIAKMIQRPWQSIMDEIAKCDIVCSNCHRERTFLRNSAVE